MNASTTALLTRERLDAASERLAPLPAAVNRLTAMLGEDDVDVRAIVDIVTYDPVLTAVLLGQANSAHAGFVRAASTVSESVMRLGLGAVAAIAMRTAVADSLQQSLPLYGPGEAVLMHSIKTSVAADVLRGVCPALIPAATATIALLHDVGKILISDVFGSSAVDLVGRLSESQGVSLIDAELDVFGVHHGHAGVHAIRRWRLPMSFIDAVANHHCPQDEGSVLARAVQAADLLANALDRRAEAGGVGDVTGTEVAAALDALGIDFWSHEQVLADIELRFEWVQGMLGAS